MKCKYSAVTVLAMTNANNDQTHQSMMSAIASCSGVLDMLSDRS